MQPTDHAQHRLLIMDGHLNHIIMNVIAFYMQNAIDLFIMPPHYSHLFQLLDISVFVLLKHTLNKKINTIN